MSGIIDHVTFRCLEGHEWTLPVSYVGNLRLRLEATDEERRCSECGREGTWIGEVPR